MSVTETRITSSAIARRMIPWAKKEAKMSGKIVRISKSMHRPFLCPGLQALGQFDLYQLVAKVDSPDNGFDRRNQAFAITAGNPQHIIAAGGQNGLHTSDIDFCLIH